MRRSATAIGFYDGFFGPGAGTFYTTSLVALRGYGLTRATAVAKLINLTSALATLLLFALGGHMLWLLGACMAVGAMARRLDRQPQRAAASARGSSGRCWWRSRWR